jgi:hypothetical protein
LCYARADKFGESRMNEIDTERMRAAAKDLVDVLSAYDVAFVRLERDAPKLARLREAIGTALAEASHWNLDSDARIPH